MGEKALDNGEEFFEQPIVRPIERDHIGRLRIVFPEATAGLSEDGLSSQKLGIPLVVTDFIQEEVPQIADTETSQTEDEKIDLPDIDVKVVRHILNTRDNRTPDIRIEELLRYELGEPYDKINISVPLSLKDYLPEDLASWVRKNKPLIDSLNNKNRAKYSKTADLVEDTLHLEDTPWLQRAVRVRNLMTFNTEAEATEIAVRLLLRDAEREREILEN